MEWRPGEYCFLTLAGYEKEISKASARIHSLHDSPQANCEASIEVYLGPYWVQPKYMKETPGPRLIPLYLGPLIYDPASFELAVANSMQ